MKHLKALFLSLSILLLTFVSGFSAENTIRIAYPSDANSLDMYQNWDRATIGFSMNIYDPLVDYDTDTGFIPRLAVRWEHAEPNRWRFWLREGVQFHDGQPFTAEDVVFSANRMLHPNSKGKGVLRDVIDIVAVDDYTVDFITSKPHPYLINQFNSWMIMSKSWAEENDATAPADFVKGETGYAASHENGTGPFMIESREAGVRTTLVKNPNWWGNEIEGTNHNLTRVVVEIIESPATRVAALLSGEVDLIVPVSPQDIERIRGTPGLKLLVGTEARAVFLGMDQWRDELLYSSVKGKNPFKDRRVRKAIRHALNIEAINKSVFRGTIKPNNMIIFEGVSGWDAKYKAPEYDPELARELLAEAGYPDGFEVTLDCSNDREIGDAAACEAVSALLARVGIKVSVLAQTTSRWDAKIQKLDTSFYRFSWGANGWASLNTLRDLIQCKESGKFARNMGGYCNPEIDEYIVKASGELDVEKRNSLIDQAWQMVTEDIPYIPLYTNPLLWAARDNVSIKVRPDMRVYFPTIRMN
jgi:peptide/nickel transport system substrate-binding protein